MLALLCNEYYSKENEFVFLFLLSAPSSFSPSFFNVDVILLLLLIKLGPVAVGSLLLGFGLLVTGKKEKTDRKECI